MNNKRRESKVGLVSFAICLILRMLTLSIESIATSKIIHFVMGILVGLSLLAVISEFISDNVYEKIKRYKKF